MGENFNLHVLLLKKLSTRKVTQINDFPVKILKKNIDISSDNISKLFNFCVNEGKCPNIFKYRETKESYCPMSILLAITKMFEILPSKPGTVFIDQFVSK